ncbi:MAG: hypothetical protein OEX02_04175 [Cyclobacteriaceae bacterium]|nr:hypothetical protein [Cyclobacteriaceae bacterium]
MKIIKNYFILLLSVLPIFWIFIYDWIDKLGIDMTYQVAVLFIIAVFALIIYLKILWANENLDKNSKVTWTFLFLIFFNISSLIYWIRYIYPNIRPKKMIFE